MSLKKDIKKGTLLISEPSLRDENFSRSVILICEHGEEGAFGLILNKPTNHTLEDVPEISIELPVNLYVGGPVELNTLHFIHTKEISLQNEIEIAKGIFWGGDFEEMRQKLLTGLISDETIRFFIGYSGWEAGQLEKEIEESFWIPIDRQLNDILMIEPDNLWQFLLKELGGDYRDLANYPIDPRDN